MWAPIKHPLGWSHTNFVMDFITAKMLGRYLVLVILKVSQVISISQSQECGPRPGGVVVKIG